MKDKEQKPAELEASEKLAWRKPRLQKLLSVDQTFSYTGNGNDGSTTDNATS